MSAVPDTQGFINAQRQLVEHLGEDVEFIVPGILEWPPDAQIDQQTGRPYDPTIDPISGQDESVTIKVTVVYRPISATGDDVVEGASGVRRDESPAFIVLTEEYEAVKDAIAVIYNDVKYRITEFMPDSFVNVLYRWTCFTEPT